MCPRTIPQTESPRQAARRIVREVLVDHAADPGPLGAAARAELDARRLDVRAAFIAVGETYVEVLRRLSGVVARVGSVLGLVDDEAAADA